MGINPDGGTRIMAIVGDPVIQVKGPESWSRLFEANGVNAVCVPMHVSPADLEGFLDGIRPMHNLVGLVMTIPHKPVALRLCASLSERARRVGAVNVMRVLDDGWAGDILDGVGFVAGLRAQGKNPAGLRTLLVGAGGVGRAIGVALAEAGAGELAVFDVDPERAAAVCAIIAEAGTPAIIGVPDASGFDLVINASPVGMRPGDGSPIDLSGVSPATIVADVVVKPAMTPLLLDAARRGCYAHSGTHMMNGQLAAIATFMGLGGPADSAWSAAELTKLVMH